MLFTGIHSMGDKDNQASPEALDEMEANHSAAQPTTIEVSNVNLHNLKDPRKELLSLTTTAFQALKPFIELPTAQAYQEAVFSFIHESLQSIL